jgi:hypothetical protein
MTDTTITSRHCRASKPERITVGDETFVRNDVLAKEQGASERTINRLDAEGAPYTYLAGVKFRPLERFHAFLLSRIRVRKPPKRRAA